MDAARLLSLCSNLVVPVITEVPRVSGQYCKGGNKSGQLVASNRNALKGAEIAFTECLLLQ
jgi:hypothetical protein